MKKLFKILVSALALSAISATVVCCGFANSLKQKICEHEFGKSEIVVEATCTTKGQAKKICSICGYEELEETTTTHKNLVYDDGFPATCEEEGLTYGYYCEDCGFVEGMQIIEKLPHADENNDGFCDNCPTNILGLKEMIAVTNGTSIANKWFRFYRQDSEMSFRELPISLYIYSPDNPENKYSATFMVGSFGSSYQENLIFCAGPLYTVDGLIVYHYDEYYDIYFAEGIYNVMNCNEVFAILTIDDSLVFNASNLAYLEGYYELA